MAKKVRYFVRIDSKGVPVPGSNQNRAKKPVANGRWDEFRVHDCCGPEIILTPDATGSDESFTISCDASGVLTILTTGDYDNLFELAGILNDQAGYLGVFAVDGDTIKFQVNKSVAAALCDGTLTIDQD